MMFLNHIKISTRNLLKNKLHTLINLVGFSTGLAVAFLIISYVRHEFSYDKFHVNADRIYRANILLEMDGEVMEGSMSPNILGPTMKEVIPEVENYVRMFTPLNRNPTIIVDDEKFIIERFYYADSTLLDVFSIEIIHGSQVNLFKLPEDVIISESKSLQLFGSLDIIGQTFQLSDKQEFIVRAIYKDLPSNSHIHPSIIASSLSSTITTRQLTWGNANYFTYILLDKDAEIHKVQEKFLAYTLENLKSGRKSKGREFHFIPLTDIRLHSDTVMEPEPVGDIKLVSAFIVIAVFILIIACVNYMNLATARSLERAKEVGMRKMLGGLKSQLILQFLIEAFLITFISLLIANLMVIITEPFFNRFFDHNIKLNYLIITPELGLLLVAALVLSLLAGIYPAFALSSFQPSQVLKGNYSKSRGGILTRKALVVFQFIISTIMIISSMVIFNQVRYMHNQKLGFDKEHVIIINMSVQPEDHRQESFKKTLLQHNNIREVSFSSAYPGRNSGGFSLHAEGMEEDEKVLVWAWRVEEDFVDAMGFNMINGKKFSFNTAQRQDYEFIINETAMNIFNWTQDDCIGNKINIQNYYKGQCVGLVEDFHITSLKDKVDPIVLFVSNNSRRFVIIRTETAEISPTLNFIKNTWNDQMSELAFSYNFLDESFDLLYKREQNTLKLSSVFSLLTVIIAGLGIFGLSAYDTESRTKEIGVRKTLGASEIKIFSMIVRNYVTLILYSFILSMPIAWIMMNRWLQEYAYKTDLRIGIFIMAGLITLLLVIISVGYQSIKAASTNPSTALRYE